jgi:hypothetical protein
MHAQILEIEEIERKLAFNNLPCPASCPAAFGPRDSEQLERRATIRIVPLNKFGCSWKSADFHVHTARRHGDANTH